MQSQTKPTALATPTANTFPAIFYRSYSRRIDVDGKQVRESWQEAITRAFNGLVDLGKFTEEQQELIYAHMIDSKTLPSGRWMWIGGTPWIQDPKNFGGSYNCSSVDFDDIRCFGLMMKMAMEGSGTGAVLEPKYIDQLPEVRTKLNIKVGGMFGWGDSNKTTQFNETENGVKIAIGDSRQGWADTVDMIIELATRKEGGEINVTVDYSNVRPKGAKLKGFGGVANPSALPGLFPRMQDILNGALGRKLTSVEICLLIDECAKVVVAGNVRRCLPENALVHTSKGLVPIKNVQIGDMVQTPVGLRKVTNKFDQGEQNVYEVDSNGGFTRATTNHKYAVLKCLDTDDDQVVEWIPLGEIRENDRLLFNRQILPGIRTSLPSDFTAARPSHSTTCGNFTVPELDAEIAWLIGYTHGNGCIQMYKNKHNKMTSLCSWSFSRNYGTLGGAISDRLINAISRFDCTAKRKEKKGENTSIVSVTAIRLAEYFQRYIKVPNVPITVPDFILQGSSDIRAAYMAGLYDSDGAQNNRPAIAVTTIYTDFARQLSAVLGSLGVPCRISVTVEANRIDARPKYNLTLPSLRFMFNDRIAPYSCKGKIKDGSHEAHGFSIPTEFVRAIHTPAEIRSQMGSACPVATVAKTNVSFKRFVEHTNSSMDIPITFKGLSSVDVLPTWDIEVEGEHCFYVDGYLVHNSAGMRQGASDDAGFAVAKENLWGQDEAGNWRIDPARDALRMANHTRVFHVKPDYQTIRESVAKQFQSGEGAIQYAPEALVRANRDILLTADRREKFVEHYEQGKGADYIQSLYPEMDEAEIDHRMSRYGMNPCFVKGTEIMIRENGNVTSAPIESLVGKTVEIWDGDNWVSNSNFRITGNDQNVYKLSLDNGEEYHATEYHNFILQSGDKCQLTCLTPGMELRSHDGGVHTTVTNVVHVGIAKDVYCTTVESTGMFALASGLMSGNCGEIIGSNFYCNLSEIHLNQLDPWDFVSQEDAFTVGGWIAAALLHHKFVNQRQQYSRELDPIVGVSFTGAFDFFVNMFGIEWLRWWQADRAIDYSGPTEAIKILQKLPEPMMNAMWDILGDDSFTLGQVFYGIERLVLEMWQDCATEAVEDYCIEHGLKIPNRSTTVQPAGSKSLITGASPGWHPPKGSHYIRRVTFPAKDPLALTLMKRGYSIVPGQSDKDAEGMLLNDPFDPRCTEWLVEIPVELSWGKIPGVDQIDINMFSARAQFDFYMQVQNRYTTHNTSATIELREHEISEVASLIHGSIGDGYISATLLPRSDAPFPRMPFEVITRERYLELQAQVVERAEITDNDILTVLRQLDNPDVELTGPAQCDSDFCLK